MYPDIVVVAGGLIVVTAGTTYIIDPSVSGNVDFIAPPGETDVAFDVRIVEDNLNSFEIRYTDGLIPTVSVEDGVVSGEVSHVLSDVGKATITIGDGAFAGSIRADPIPELDAIDSGITISIGQAATVSAVSLVVRSDENIDPVRLNLAIADDAEVGKITATGADLRLNMTIGNNVQLFDGVEIEAAGDSIIDVNAGNDITIEWGFEISGTEAVSNVTFGDNLTVEYLPFQVVGERATVTLGDNLTVEELLFNAEKGNIVVIGDNWNTQTIVGADGPDDFTLGVAAAGIPAPVTVGARNGADSIKIVVRAADQDAFDAAATAAGWIFDADSGNWTPGGNPLVWQSVSYEEFETVTTAVCFTRGTMIRTPDGDVPIESLKAGDLVMTLDDGPQPVRWIGSTRLLATGQHAPILIRKGALGNTRDLRVSPQHRMLLTGWQAEILFGEHETLATAKALVNDHSILRVEGGEVEYHHILFDRHQIILAEGAPSESFHPGQEGWKALGEGTRAEIVALFPQLAGGCLDTYGPAARRSLRTAEAKVLARYIGDDFLIA